MPKEKTVGEQFAELRNHLELTQEAMGALLGIVRTDYLRLEHKKTQPTWCQKIVLKYMWEDGGKLLKKGLKNE